MTQHLLDRVCKSLDSLIAASKPYHGLFPSLLDRHTGTMLEEFPPPIDGQRITDRSPSGSNLIHDEATLKTFYALADILNRDEYAAAADGYLRHFAENCTNTATGLFPWGEHSFWDLAKNSVGNSFENPGSKSAQPAIHDHLRQAPLWLWQKLWEFNPRCVERFAEGLDFHWQEAKRDEYIRHALIEKRQHPTPYHRSCDFPRHGGFYIFDWTFAWTKTGRGDFRRQIDVMLDYWWNKRDERGQLLIESRVPVDDPNRFYNTNAPSQTISVAASLLESADMISERDTKLSNVMRQRARVYIDGFFAAPHDPDNAVFVLLSNSDGSVNRAMPIWGSKYGIWPASYAALTCLCTYRMISDERLLDWAQAVGRCYVEQPFPEDVAVPAMDAGLGLSLLADLYDITGDTAWRDSGLHLAKKLTATYMDAPLPRGAAGIDWYESQMGPGFLLHGIARIALLAQNRSNCLLTPDYTAR